MSVGPRIGLFFVAAMAVSCLASCRRTQELGPPKAVAVRDDGVLELNIASFNIRYENDGDTGERAWPSRLRSTVRIIRELNPDVLGVQEAYHGQAADLWASLPGYDFYGTGREDGKRAGEYAGIFFLRSRFHLDAADSGCFWLSGTPEIPGSTTWGNTLSRMVTWVHLVDRATSRGFYVFDTHWDHRHQGSREEAALLIARRIDGRKAAGDPVILVGDFNAIETNPAVRYLRGESVVLIGVSQTWSNSLLDTFTALHSGQENRRTFHQWDGNRSGNFKLDHIFVTRTAKVLRSAIRFDTPPYASDHYAVSSTVTFPPPPVD